MTHEPGASTTALPDRAALTILVGVWAERRSGWLCLASDDARAPICEGGVLSGEGMDIVERALVEGNVWFEDDEQEGLPDDFSVGLALWEAALKAADGGLGDDDLLKRILRLNPRSRSCRNLPLSKATKRVLNARPRRHPVQVHLDNLGLAADDVRRELTALSLLDLVTFKWGRRRSDADVLSLGSDNGAERAALRPSPREAVPTREPGAARRAELEKVLLLSRLQSELDRLEKADDWTALGVPAGSGTEIIEAAAERMKHRYQREVEAPRAGPEGVEPARRLLARIERAAANLLSGGDPIVEEAHRRGREAIDATDWSKAVTCFKVARERQPQSPRALAWLGWAIYNDGRRAVDARREEGGDLIKLAASFDHDEVPELQWFLARLEADTGAAEDAQQRLARALKKHPDLPPGARKLFLALRRRA